VTNARAVSFVPMDGESACSLLLRAASLVSPFPSLVVEHLLGDADAIASTVHRHDVIDAIASSFGIDETVLEGTMIHKAEPGLRIGPFVVRTRDVDQTRRRVSPQALRSDRDNGEPPYQRLTWTIRAIRHDPTSSAPIIDRCGCGCDLFWSQTVLIEECPSCGSLLWESTRGEREPQDGEAVQFLGGLFSSSMAHRDDARSRLPPLIAQWTEGDLLEFFETLGLFTHLEALTRLPREDVEVWVRAVGIRAALEGMEAVRKLIGRAFDDPPAGAERFWSTRRIGLANLVMRRCPSDPVRTLLEHLLRTFV
jgi:hypothetical protein